MQAKPPLRFRRLRIAWSIFWALVTALLILFWVRSYWVTDSANWLIPNWREFMVGSFRGYVQFFESDRPSRGGKFSYSGLLINHVPETSKINSILFESDDSTCILGKFHYHSNPNFGTALTAPVWLAVLATGGLTGVPWLRSRFNLRALLIAMTLVAIMLGLVVYAVSS